MRVLLIDDEYWVIQSIKAKIDWTRYGMQVVGEAYNGLDGLQAIQALQPDLVFSDIRMPGLTGIAMMEKAVEAGSDAKFIFISGYSEFRYAQQAIGLGALGYILKSFEEEEIHSVLENAVRRIQGQKERDIGRLAGLMLTQTAEANGEIGKILVKHGLSPSTVAVRLAVVRGNEIYPQAEAIRLGLLPIQCGKDTNAYLLAEEKLPLLTAIQADGAKDIKGIGISPIIPDVESLSNMVLMASVASGQYFVTGKVGQVASYQPTANTLHKIVHSTQKALDEKDIQKAFGLLDEAVSLGLDDGININDAFYFFNAIMSSVYHHEREPAADQREEAYLHSHEALLEMYPDFQRAVGAMKESITSIYSQSPASQKARHAHQHTESFRQYIAEHYTENLTLRDIAEHFNFHPDYVSQLFNKELHTSFTQYLLDVRLREACRLLVETGSSVAEIARKVGYMDYFYFAKVFKKAYKVTPTQFRMKR